MTVTITITITMFMMYRYYNENQMVATKLRSAQVRAHDDRV